MLDIQNLCYLAEILIIPWICKVHNDDITMILLAFRAIGTDIGNALMTNKTASLIGKITLNHWNNKESAEFIIEDVILNSNI